MRKDRGQDGETAALMARLQDWADQCRTRRKTVRSCFLTAAEQRLMEDQLPWDLAWKWDGGCQNAERKKLILAMEEDELESDVVCLTARVSDKFVQLTHRDVLGALMNLNLDRSQFGDLWVEPGRVVIYTEENLADYVIMSLTRIHRLTLNLQRSAMMYEPLVRTEPMTLVVASFRIDSLVAAVCHCSRSKAQELIRAQKVSVNHKILAECSFLCHNEDTISVRGYGRFVLKGQSRRTRSERIVAEFEKYI